MPAKKAAAPKAKATKSSPAKKVARKIAAKPLAKGDTYACEVCGLAVVVDTECGCVDVHEIICCEKAMKPRKAKATRAKTAAKA